MYKPYVFDRIDPSFSYIENYFLQKDELPPGSEEEQAALIPVNEEDEENLPMGMTPSMVQRLKLEDALFNP